MEILSRKRCIIGEGPIWNANERVAYIMNGLENEICKIDISSGELCVMHTRKLVAALAFDKENRMIASCLDGVFYLDGDEMTPLYDTEKYNISGGNDMKVGPDGRMKRLNSSRYSLARKLPGLDLRPHSWSMEL